MTPDRIPLPWRSEHPGRPSQGVDCPDRLQVGRGFFFSAFSPVIPRLNLFFSPVAYFILFEAWRKRYSYALCNAIGLGFFFAIRGGASASARRCLT